MNCERARRYTGPFDCLYKVATQEGIKGIYAGESRDSHATLNMSTAVSHAAPAVARFRKLPLDRTDDVLSLRRFSFTDWIIKLANRVCSPHHLGWARDDPYASAGLPANLVKLAPTGAITYCASARFRTSSFVADITVPYSSRIARHRVSQQCQRVSEPGYRNRVSR